MRSYKLTHTGVRVNDRIGCKLDLNARTIEFSVNDTSMGIAFSDIPQGQYVFCCDMGHQGDQVELL